MEQTIEEKPNNTLKIVIIIAFIFLILGIGGYLVYMYAATPNASQVQNTDTNSRPNTGQETDRPSPGNQNNSEVAAPDQITPIEGQSFGMVEEEDVVTEPTPYPSIDPSEAWTKITTDSTLSLGQEGSLIVSGYSEGTNIDGYDVLLSYDPEKVEIVEVKSLIPAFNIKSFIREDFVSVTGYKSPDIEEDTIFSDTPLLEYTILPIEEGTVLFKVLPEKGVETTKYVDSDVNITNPQPQAVEVSIE